MRRTGAAALAAVVAAAVLAGAPAAAAGAPQPRWTWPTADHRVVRGFQTPVTAYAAGHRGLDLAAGAGTAVHAPDDGVVAFAGRVAGRGVVSIDHAGVRSTLEPVDPSVRAGRAVRRGQVVGVVADGGAHPAGVLHLGARIRQGDGWAYVSPLLLLGGARRAVLLPLAAFPGG